MYYGLCCDLGIKSVKNLLAYFYRMENSIVFTDMDNSCNVYRPIDASSCYIREPFDLSNTFFREHFEGKEILLGQSIREYFYFTGSPGPIGPSGPIGPPGPAGPAGPISSNGGGSDTFLNVYSSNQQQVSANSPVIFDMNNYVQGSCAHSSATSQIHLWKSGFYYVYTNIYHIEGCQFSLYKNKNTIIPGSTIGSLTGSSQNSNVVILRVNPDDIITDSAFSPSGKACIIELYNNTAYIPFVTLYDSSGLGYSVSQINATMTIFLLNT